MESRINEKAIDFLIDKNIYNEKAIMKSAYNFTDNYYVKLDYENEKIKVTLKPKDKKRDIDLEALKGEFLNELLKESVRYIVSKDTKNIRELLMGKALYDTCIECDDEEDIEDNDDDDDISIDDNLDIFMNWFDKNGE